MQVCGTEFGRTPVLETGGGTPGGRDFRLADVHGRVIHDIIA